MNNSKIKEQYEYLREIHSLLSSEMVSLQEDHRQQQLELSYLKGFIRWKKLEEEYNYFMENAHEAWDENLPFSYFTL